MLARSGVCLCVSVGVACRTMGFRVPPRNQKELKKRYITLTKEIHPDQNAGSGDDATRKMIELTEAYKSLKKMLDTGVHAVDMHNKSSSQRNMRGGFGATDASMEEVAASFVAPGASLSLRGFTLPWQVGVSKSRAARLMEDLDKSRDLSFGEYVAAVRAVEKERAHKEEARRRDAAAASGSHGFTAEYFEQMHAARERIRGTNAAGDGGGDGGGAKGTGAGDLGKKLPTAVLPLAWRFYSKRIATAVRQGPRRSWDALRYIVFGN